MSSAYFKTEGLVIKKTPFAEADFLVRVLTRDFGKMDALAKGARKAASKLNPHLDILNHIRMQFVKNGERIPTLMDAEIIAKYDDWFSDADKLSIMGRVLQVIDMVVLPGAKDEKIFLMILNFFEKAKNEAGALNFLREFFRHEGHGDSLPEEREEAILKLWPRLKN